jgi:hypothetical protein
MCVSHIKEKANGVRVLMMITTSDDEKEEI